MKRYISIILALMLLMATTVLAAPGDLEPGTVETDDEILRTVAAINEIRDGIGLEPYILDEKLKAMALTHSKYMHNIDELTTIEDSEQLYFRGRYPWDRADSEGYDKSFVYEIVKTDYANYISIYDDLMEDPVSRTILMNPMYTDIGMGVYEGYFTFDLGGNIPEISKGYYYPYNGQTDVSTRWQGELLDELNKDTNISIVSSGLPVTYTYYGEDILGISDKYFSITNTATGDEVPYELIEPGINRQLKNTVTLIPLDNYLYGSTYEVHMRFDMKIDDRNDLVEVDETFTFTATSPVKMTTVEQKFVTREAFTEKVMINSNLTFELIEPLEIKFNDVEITSSNSIYINTASELGLINGYPDGRFGPTLNISKEQAYKILVLAYMQKVPSVTLDSSADLSDYEDLNDVSGWAMDYIRFAKELNILIDDAGYIHPKAYMTDEEFQRIMTLFDSNFQLNLDAAYNRY